MCGIVGMIGTDIGYNHKKAFKDLLVIDTIRGGDSTGILGVDGNDVITAKKAIDGYGFTNMSLFTKQMTAMSDVSALIGHNRAATRGKVTDGNAHPFKMDNTYLVHNGSLTTWRSGDSKLHDSEHTDVDSEAICFDVNKNGFKHTIEKLDGAFALVTYDSISKTISFARNEDRPLWFVKQKDKDVLMYASEAYMLYLVADKHGLELDEEVWLLQSGTIMSFDVADKVNIYNTMDFDLDVTLYEKPVYTEFWGEREWDMTLGKYVKKKETYLSKKEEIPPTGTESGSGDGIIDNVTPLLPSPNKKTLKDLGRVLGEHLLFMPHTFKVFEGSTYGMVTGDLYLDGLDKYKSGEAIMYRQDEEAFNWMRGKMVAVTARNVTYPYGREKEHLLCVDFCEILSWEQEEEYWVAFGDDSYNFGTWDDVVPALGFIDSEGMGCTSEHFKDITKHGCAMCSEAIPTTEEVSQEVAWVFDKNPLCPSCADLQGRMAEANDISLEEQITGGAL